MKKLNICLKHLHIVATILLAFYCNIISAAMQKLPNDFVFITNVDPTIIESPRYYGNENFLGRKIVGYTQPRIISTKTAAIALKAVQAELNAQGYKLVVYDGYRPQRSVNEFMRWSKDPRDQIAKSSYYPNIDKKMYSSLVMYVNNPAIAVVVHLI